MTLLRMLTFRPAPTSTPTPLAAVITNHSATQFRSPEHEERLLLNKSSPIESIKENWLEMVEEEPRHRSDIDTVAPASLNDSRYIEINLQSRPSH